MADETKPATPTGQTGDNATASGKETPTTLPGAEKPTEEKPTGEQPGGETSQDDKGEKGEKKDKLLTSTEVSAIVAREIEKERKKMKTEQEEADAQKRGEWQQLAESRKVTITDMTAQLDTANNQLAAVVTASATLLRAQIKAFPAEVRAAAPVDLPEADEELDALEIGHDDFIALSKWIPKGMKLADSIAGREPEQPAYKGGPTPRKGEKPADDKQPQADITKRQKSTGRYNM